VDGEERRVGEGHETASVGRVGLRCRRQANGSTRYLFAIPQFKDGGSFAKDYLPPKDQTLTLRGIGTTNVSATLLGDGNALECDVADGGVTIKLPANKRTELVDVVRVELSGDAQPAANAAK
jgi:hypothetical protein